MPNADRLAILTELRKHAGITLSSMAHQFSLISGKHRDTVAAWERGLGVPRGYHRDRFIEYLGTTLGLRYDPVKFHAVWQVLVEEWEWEPVSEEEWKTHFGDTDFSQTPKYNTRQTLLIFLCHASTFSQTPKYNTRQTLLIFLCHASTDKPHVRKLYQQLRDNGFDPWLDEEDLLPGQDWDQEIRRAVHTADVVVVCLSRASVTKTGYTQKELRHALDVADEQPDGTIFIIPAKLEDCQVPERLQRWQWVNLYEDRGLERLLLALTACAKPII